MWRAPENSSQLHRPSFEAILCNYDLKSVRHLSCVNRCRVRFATLTTGEVRFETRGETDIEVKRGRNEKRKKDVINTGNVLVFSMDFLHFEDPSKVNGTNKRTHGRSFSSVARDRRKQNLTFLRTRAPIYRADTCRSRAKVRNISESRSSKNVVRRSSGIR